ncbi:MAG: hypothetical protein ACTHU0_22175 [Kofleriaceae bacterium]
MKPRNVPGRKPMPFGDPSVRDIRFRVGSLYRAPDGVGSLHRAPDGVFFGNPALLPYPPNYRAA